MVAAVPAAVAEEAMAAGTQLEEGMQAARMRTDPVSRVPELPEDPGLLALPAARPRVPALPWGLPPQDIFRLLARAFPVTRRPLDTYLALVQVLPGITRRIMGISLRIMGITTAGADGAGAEAGGTAPGGRSTGT